MTTMTTSKPAVKSSKQVRTHQPTYRLNAQKPFKVEKVEQIIKNILETELEEVEYNEKLIPEICLNIVSCIKSVVKGETYDRCRIIAVVTIGQRRQQSIQIVHAFLWDAERDNYAAYYYENNHIFAQAVVYGIYLD